MVNPAEYGLPIMTDQGYYEELRKLGPIGQWAAACLEHDQRSIMAAQCQAMSNGQWAQQYKAALEAIKERGDTDDSAKAMYHIARKALEPSSSESEEAKHE
jgi:hypothetical protein